MACSGPFGLSGWRRAEPLELLYLIVCSLTAEADCDAVRAFGYDGEPMTVQMLNPDNYLLNPRSVSVLVVGAGIFCLGIFVLFRERGSRVGVKFWLVATTITVWLLSFGVAYASRQESIAFRWFQVGDIGVVLIPTAFFSLIAAMTQQEHRLRSFVRVSGAVSLLFCGSVFSTDHFMRGLYHYSWGLYPRYGFLGLLFLLYFFVMTAAALVIFYRAYRNSTHPRNRRRYKWLLRSFTIGFVSAFDFAAKLGIPLYPFGYLPLGSYLMIASWIIVRYRLVDITPELASGQILETMQGAVIVADLEGRIRVANGVAQDLLGYSRGELLGRDLTSILTVPAAVTESINGGKRATSYEVVWPGKDGQRHDVSLSASILSDDRTRDPVGVVYVAQDITERKKAEEGLHQASKDLQDFAYIVSHDLRAPLVSIKGFSRELEASIKDLDGLLQKRFPELDPGERRKIESLIRVDVPEAVHFIGSSATRMDKMIGSILALSRMGRRKLKPEELDLSMVVRTIQDSLAHQIAERRVDVTVAQLPRVMADKFAMEQVLGNLLDNALKYLDPSRSARVEIGGDSRDGEIVIHVRDNGRGMAKDEIPKAFELFRRVGKQDVPGEGMGLAYVKALVRSMGGRIWCESEPGSGTTFSVAVPSGSGRESGNP